MLATVCNKQMCLERKMTFYVKERLKKEINLLGKKKRGKKKDRPLKKCKWRELQRTTVVGTVDSSGDVWSSLARAR